MTGLLLMYELSHIQVDLLSQKISTVIRDAQLQTELIDHCCCAVEELMTEGNSFDDALDQALYRLHPEGIHEIEVAVQYVLQPQTLKAMKVILFLTGFLAAFTILLGTLFKMMHWPGANQLLISGDLFLIISMFTLIASSLQASRAIPKSGLARTLVGASGGLILGIGSAFKIMHWPSANILIVVGIVLVTFVFLPLFFWQLYRREIKSA